VVLRQLAVLKVNIRKLDDRVQNLTHSNSTVLTNSIQEIDLNDLMEEFPINTEESLKKIELSLTDKTYKLNLVCIINNFFYTNKIIYDKINQYLILLL